MNQEDLDRLTTQMNQFMERENRKRFPPAKVDELRELGAKRCGKCSTVKNIEEFSISSRNRDGLDDKCKACKSTSHASYREANPEKIAAIKSEYYQANREREIERNHKYYQANRERLLEQQREYYHANRERRNEYIRNWREANPEYEHNRYRDPNDNYRLTMQLNRGYHRATEAGNTAVRVTPEELLAHWESIGLDPWICYLTGDPLDHLTRSIDHIDAIGNGGSHTVENLAPCTFEANNKKKTTTPEEAREKLSA